jgi:lysophospholipase L1-like esterase
MKLAVMALAWVGTWATAPQPFMPGSLETYRNETLRLIVHVSEGGPKVRVHISNVYGDEPLAIGAAHVARRAMGADIVPMSDRPLLFHGQPTASVPAHGMLISDPVDLDVPALTDLAISLYLPSPTDATTSHLLALQTSYVATGDTTATAHFPVAKKIDTWPFLTGVDIVAPAKPAIVVIGSSTTDGDGSNQDANHRWPDVLAERLGNDAGVLNLGIIGNRLLNDSPSATSFGRALGESVLARYQRDVLNQSGVKFIVVCIGINDIVFPGTFTPAAQAITSQNVIDGYRQLISRAHAHGIRISITTIPPFENARYPGNKNLIVFTPEKEAVRQQVNDWIRATHEFDAVIDFDAVLRDPQHPTRLLPQFDSGDHLHCNDAGYAATANAVPLNLFRN